MTFTAVLLFAAATYALRLTGPFLHDRIQLSDRTQEWLTLPAVALLSALAATSTLLPGGDFDSTARVIGVSAGVLAAIRGLPFIVVVILAAGATAVLRRLGIP